MQVSGYYLESVQFDDYFLISLTKKPFGRDFREQIFGYMIPNNI